MEAGNVDASKSQESQRQSRSTYLSNPLMGDFVSDWSPLHDASLRGCLLTLKKLINQGTNVNLLTADHVSPLHEACLGGHSACASVLLKHGAHVNGATVDCNTPLFNACASGSVECLNLLLQHGASPQAVCDLASPIHEAAKRGHIKCVESLVSYGVNIDHNIKHLGSPLYVACEHQQVDCVKKLLESGASVNDGKDLESPLHVAVQNASDELVHLLIDFGADMNALNAEGKKPAELVPPNSTLTQIFLQREVMNSGCQAVPLVTLDRPCDPQESLIKALPAFTLVGGPAETCSACYICLHWGVEPRDRAIVLDAVVSLVHKEVLGIQTATRNKSASVAR